VQHLQIYPCTAAGPLRAFLLGWDVDATRTFRFQVLAEPVLLLQFQAHRAFCNVPEKALESLVEELSLEVTEDTGANGQTRRIDQLTLTLMVHFIPDLTHESLDVHTSTPRSL
jgi:hypothetical protein